MLSGFSFFIVFVISVVDGGSRVEKVRKSKLDIVLAFDQSGSLGAAGGTEWVTTYNGVKQWTEYFYRDANRSSETHMAVVGMHDTEPLYFTTDKRKILDKIKKSINIGEGNNAMVRMANMIKDQVFTKYDRPDAPNIIFFISDCVIYEESGDNAIIHLHDICTLFMFICTKTPEEYTKKWVKNDEKKIFVYQNYPEFQKYIDDLLDQYGQTENITVIDCDFVMVDGDCELINNKQSCIKIMYPKINVQPYPIGYGKECPPNKTKECDMNDCLNPTTRLTTMAGLAVSDVVGNGNETNNGEKVLAGESSTKKSSMVAIIIGVSIGLVLLLLLLLLLIFLVLRRRRQQKGQKNAAKTEPATEVKGREHDQGVKADLTVMPSMFGNKTSKKMAARKQGAAKTSKSVTQSKTGKAGPSKKAAKK